MEYIWYLGNRIKIIEDPYLAGSIYNLYYEASGLTDNNELISVIWEIKSKHVDSKGKIDIHSIDINDMCDWENPNSVESI